ncbi:MAG TPA: SDR family oxidoreductase [Pseudoclavibacter sp.]|nr:SDR family oxidoreductase [Pseudoclavibacter sp.]
MSTPIAIVTGASSGIGREIARNLSADHEVHGLGRNEQNLAALARDAGVVPHTVDLRDNAALASVAASFDRVDVLVHAAAVFERHTVEDAQYEDWQKHFETNVFAPAELTRLLLPALRRAEANIVFINSGAGRRSVPGHTIYSASKYALLAIADGLRHDLAPENIRVSTVSPGPTQTPGGDRDGGGYTQKSDPRTVAEAVRWVVTAPGDSQITELWVRPRNEG